MCLHPWILLFWKLLLIEPKMSLLNLFKFHQKCQTVFNLSPWLYLHLEIRVSVICTSTPGPPKFSCTCSRQNWHTSLQKQHQSTEVCSAMSEFSNIILWLQLWSRKLFTKSSTFHISHLAPHSGWLDKRQNICNATFFIQHAISKVNGIMGIPWKTVILHGIRKILMKPLYSIESIELLHTDWWNNFCNSTFLW